MYNRIPRDSELYRYARRGDWDSVRLLLENGHASPFDQTYHGRTLLHEAVTGLNYDACVFLLNCGLYPCATDGGLLRVLDCLANGLSLRKSQLRQCEIAEQGQTMFSLIANSCPSYCFDAGDLTFAIGSYPSEVVTRVKNLMHAKYESVDPCLRAELAMRSTSLDYRTVLEILGSDQTLGEAFALLERSGSECSHRALLYSAAFNLGILHVADCDDAFRQGWMSIVSQIVTFESQSSTAFQFEGPLMKFVFGCYRRLTEMEELRQHSPFHDPHDFGDLTEVARVWLRILKEAGADLNRYGHAEKQYLLRPSDWTYCLVDSRHNTFYYMPRYLTYGPLVEDWKIYVVPIEKHHHTYNDGYERRTYSGPEGDAAGMAGQFWRTVETPELFNIPGAYLAQFEEDCDSFESQEYLFLQAPCL